MTQKASNEIFTFQAVGISLRRNRSFCAAHPTLTFRGLSLDERKIYDVQIQRKLIMTRARIRHQPLAPIPLHICRCRELSRRDLPGDRERVDHVRNSVRAENRWAFHQMKV